MCECQALHPDPDDEDSDNDFEGEEYDVEEAEHGHADIPTFYTCDEGLSALTQEGQATLERLEGMLAQSATQQYHMAGVRTEETKAEFEGLAMHMFDSSCRMKSCLHPNKAPVGSERKTAALIYGFLL
ncbi:Methylosome subunit pICln [Xenoophorus captivus]|uniref:Methylosome subunit pICln n=1 Tax=Xenoophorus captivus TaxID=1517983 RepID=A0ABV0S1A3_9TELE